MSSFTKITMHPLTGNFELAEWLDNYYGEHNYGVKFPSGGIFKESDYEEWFFGEEEPTPTNKEDSVLDDANIANIQFS